MPAHSGSLREHYSLDFLYTRQGFDRTRMYVHLGGASFIGCPCYYCGDLATSKDHVYPIVALRSLYGLTDLPPERLLIIVPACSECNSFSGIRFFPRLPDAKTT
jgi:hypothetical protein